MYICGHMQEENSDAVILHEIRDQMYLENTSLFGNSGQAQQADARHSLGQTFHQPGKYIRV